MSERAAHILVADMVEAVERILSYTAGKTFEQFAEAVSPCRLAVLLHVTVRSHRSLPCQG